MRAGAGSQHLHKGAYRGSRRDILSHRSGGFRAVNPFEPPRTSDLEATAASADVRAVPEQAVHELVRSGPWARWTARLGLASLVVSVLYNAISFPRAKSSAEAAGLVAGLVVAVPLALIFVINFRNYAGQVLRLSRGERRAVEGVADAQRAVFKTMGIFIVVGLVLGVLLVGAAFIIGVLTAMKARQP
jgi:hypothetical protein